MTGITYVRGDATRPASAKNMIIAHVCNDLGGWGRGFVLALSARWPEPERAYREWYRERVNSDFGLGAVQLVQVETDTWVANMVGQHGIARSRPPSGPPPIRYDAIRACLRDLAGHALLMDAGVHMPRIGAGLAGGRWAEVEPLVQDELVGADIPVTVYDL